MDELTEPFKRSRGRPKKVRLEDHDLRGAVERAVSDPVGYAREEAARGLVLAMRNTIADLTDEDKKIRRSASRSIIELSVGKPGTQPPPIDPEAKKTMIFNDLPEDESNE